MANVSYPLFVDLGSPKPTTREVADIVKRGGTSALTEAERRADEARYQEVACRSALNAVRGMPFNAMMIGSKTSARSRLRPNQ